MPSPPTPSAFQRISQLAAQPPVHKAFQWFHLQEPQLRRWQAEILSIPAPTFQEQARASWFAGRFSDLGLNGVHIDSAGNVLATLPADTSLGDSSESRPVILLSAHLDTVFPAGTDCTPLVEETRLTGPGASDNCAGLTALLAIAAALQSSGIAPAADILFCANTAEEGEGNLRGMRHLFADPTLRSRISAAIVLDGAGNGPVVTQAVGSRRYAITLSGPGGHSWSDAGIPNPILLLSRALACFDAAFRASLAPPSPHNHPQTTWNVGNISGGTSINSIPQSAAARIDTRSTDPAQLVRLEVLLHRSIEDTVLAANRESGKPPQNSPITYSVETLGDRPAAALPASARILELLRSVDRHLAIRTDPRIASTDANIPLSLDIEAISIGAGGTGGGMHTSREWFDSTGRDLALRRILLLLLALAG